MDILRVLMTMTCDVKIDIIMCASHFVKLFFVNLSIAQLFDFLTSEILHLAIVRGPRVGGGGSKGSYGVNGYM